MNDELNTACEHCDGTGIEPIETSEYPPEPCSECKATPQQLRTRLQQAEAELANHLQIFSACEDAIEDLLSFEYRNEGVKKAQAAHAMLQKVLAGVDVVPDPARLRQQMQPSPCGEKGHRMADLIPFDGFVYNLGAQQCTLCESQRQDREAAVAPHDAARDKEIVEVLEAWRNWYREENEDEDYLDGNDLIAKTEALLRAKGKIE